MSKNLKYFLFIFISIILLGFGIKSCFKSLLNSSYSKSQIENILLDFKIKLNDDWTIIKNEDDWTLQSYYYDGKIKISAKDSKTIKSKIESEIKQRENGQKIFLNNFDINKNNWGKLESGYFYQRQSFQSHGSTELYVDTNQNNITIAIIDN